MADTDCCSFESADLEQLCACGHRAGIHVTGHPHPCESICKEIGRPDFGRFDCSCDAFMSTAAAAAIRQHAECWLDENCGGEDCPPAKAQRARGAQRGEPWSRLELQIEDGGQRHYLDGEPVHCGAGIELQTIGLKSDDYGEFTTYQQEGSIVRYEATLGRRDRDGHLLPARATLHTGVGGHEFVSEVDGAMRFRWPVRS